MITINFGDGKKFDPVGAVKRKMERYYKNPTELMVDGTIIMGASLVVERTAYMLNAITRARRK